MLDLAWKTIRARKAGFIGAFVAVLCGAALISACGVLMESGISAGVPTQRFAAAGVVVAGKQSVRAEGGDILAVQSVSEQPLVPADVRAKVAEVPGVREAVGELTFTATVVTRTGQPLPGRSGHPSLGHGWSSAVLAPFTIHSGQPPSAADEVVLDAELARRAGVSPGDTIRVAAGASSSSYRVSGIAATPDGDGLTRQSALFFTDARAQELSLHPDSFDAVGVMVQPGIDVTSRGLLDRIREAVTGGADDDFPARLETALAGFEVDVLVGADRSTAEFLDVSQTRTRLLAISGSFGGIAALVAIFVVASTLGLSIQQRRKEFALLRAVAATPRQIRKLVGGEALLLSSCAALAGGVGGIAVAYGLREAFVSVGVIPADFDLVVSPLPVLAAVLISVGAAKLAAAVVARRPSRIRPMAALGEAEIEPRALGRVRTAIGLALVAGGVVAAAVPLFMPDTAATTALTGISALVLVVGLALLGPRVVALGTKVLAGSLRRLSRVGGFLAAANSEASPRRLAASVTPLMLAIGFAVTFFFTQTTLTSAAQAQAEDAVVADFVLSNQFDGVPSDVSASAGAIPGVAAAVSVVRTQAILQYTGESPRVETAGAIGADPAGLREAIDPGIAAGSFDDLRGESVALSDGQAGFLGVDIGDTVGLFFGDGVKANLRLVATYTNNLGLGEVFLPRDLAVAHTTSRQDSQVLVRAESGADLASVRGALDELAKDYPGLVVQDRSAFGASSQSQQRTLFLVNLIALGVILLYIAISVANTLVMTTGERVREFALLQLIGSTRRQIARMVRLEALSVIAIAVVVGSLIPVVPLVLLSLALSGRPLPSGPPLMYVAIIAGAALLAYVSMTVSARSAMRPPPADAISVQV